jgi:transposase
MHAIAHAADVQDRDGGALLMASLLGAFPFLIKLYADGGYQGPEFQSAMKRILAHVTVEIVKRSDQATGFIALPKRWIVERTFAWLGRCRRLAKDWECLNHKALAFLRLASIRLMLRKLSIPHDVLGQSLSRSRLGLASRNTQAEIVRGLSNLFVRLTRPYVPARRRKSTNLRRPLCALLLVSIVSLRPALFPLDTLRFN